MFSEPRRLWAPPPGCKLAFREPSLSVHSLLERRHLFLSGHFFSARLSQEKMLETEAPWCSDNGGPSSLSTTWWDNTNFLDSSRWQRVRSGWTGVWWEEEVRTRRSVVETEGAGVVSGGSWHHPMEGECRHLTELSCCQALDTALLQSSHPPWQLDMGPIL